MTSSILHLTSAKTHQLHMFILSPYSFPRIQSSKTSNQFLKCLAAKKSIPKINQSKITLENATLITEVQDFLALIGGAEPSASMV